MNAYQLMKFAAFQANAVKADSTLAPFFTEPELLTWLNDANMEIEKSIRTLRDDWFVRVLNTSSSALKLLGTTYTPSASLAVTAGTSQITLPPDFATLRTIRTTTSGYESMVWEKLDQDMRDFLALKSVPSTFTMTPGGRVYYDIIGERTLVFTPTLNADIAVEISYVRRPRRLVNYLAGTIAVTDATTTVTGTGTVWSTGSPLDAEYLDMMFGQNTFAGIRVDWDYDGVNLARVASITDDTHLELAAVKVVTVAAGGSYTLSSIPAIPPEHHTALADFVTAQMLGKAGNAAQADRFMQKYESRKRSIQSNVTLRQPDMQFVENYDPGY